MLGSARAEPMTDRFDWRIAVVIPCYRVKKHILNVIGAIGPEVSTIYVIDDKCPEETGNFVLEHCKNSGVVACFNATQLAVGIAVIVGDQAALNHSDSVYAVVKIDSSLTF